MSLDVALNALREKNVAVDRSKIQSLLEDLDTRTFAEAWIKNNIHSQALLTREELDL